MCSSDLETTNVVLLAVEGIKSGEKFRQLAAEAAELEKPLVILKIGSTNAGSRAAASHTGSLAGDERAWLALSRQTGCVLVDTLDQFIDTLLIFQTLKPQPAHPTKRVVLFGNGGGTSVLATDYFARLGLDVSMFDKPAIDALAALKLPPGTKIGRAHV